MAKRIISISEDIKQEIAEKVAQQASAGYSVDAQGEWYVVDGERVVHAQRNRPWNPWSDDADVIAVDDLVFLYGGAEQEHADFENGVDGADDWEPAVDFALGYVPSSYDAADYEARYAEG